MDKKRNYIAPDADLSVEIDVAIVVAEQSGTHGKVDPYEPEPEE